MRNLLLSLALVMLCAVTWGERQVYRGNGTTCATAFVTGDATELACDSTPTGTTNGYFYALCY